MTRHEHRQLCEVYQRLCYCADQTAYDMLLDMIIVAAEEFRREDAVASHQQGGHHGDDIERSV